MGWAAPDTLLLVQFLVNGNGTRELGSTRWPRSSTGLACSSAAPSVLAVQALRHAQRAEGGEKRVPVAARRLARALSRERTHLAGGAAAERAGDLTQAGNGRRRQTFSGA